MTLQGQESASSFAKLGLKNLQGCSRAFWLDNIELSSLQGFIFPSFLSNVITIHEWLPHALCARLLKFCVFSFYVKELETWKASVSNLHETVVQRFFFFYFIKSSRTFEKNLFKYLSIHPDTCEIQHRITVATDSSLHRQIGSYSTRDKGTDTRDGVNMVTKVLKSAFPNCSMCGMQTLYRIRHRATSRKYMLLSDAAFHVPAVPTGRVCLFHVLTVEADLTCVHTTVWFTVWLVHLLKFCFSL